MSKSTISKNTMNNFQIDNLQFEKLLSMLSVRFINVPSQDIDNIINESLKNVSNFLGLDVLVLWQINKENTDEFYMTHYYRKYPGPEIPAEMNAKKTSPWALQNILNKKIIKYKDFSELPPEAATDIKTRQYLNLKSNLSFPLFLGNGPVFGVLSFNTIKFEIEWTEEIVNKLQFLAQIFTNALSRKFIDISFLENLNFEKLISSLSAKFINVPAEKIDDIINESLNQICELLGFDISSLWQMDRDNPEDLYLTHYYRRYEGQEVPQKLKASESFPWSLQKLIKKEIVKYKNSSDLSHEAEIDKKSNSYFNVKSSLTLPLYTGNRPVFGVISFNTVQKEVNWTKEITDKLQFISQVLANALSRRNSEKKLRESEERLRLAASSAEAGFWDIILDTYRVWVNEGARNFYNFKRGDTFHIDDFIKMIHPDDRNKVKNDILNSVHTGKYSNEHRILLPDGKIRWIMGRGSIQNNKEEKPERLIGVSIDITNSKEIENELKNSEKLKSSILDSIYSHILVLDSKGIIISVNKSWRQFTTENKCLGKEFNISPGDNYPEIIENASKDGSKDLSKHLRGIKSVLNGKSPKYESQYSVTSDFNEFWFFMYVIPLENERKNFILVNIDITELKKTQKSLKNALDDVKMLKEQLHKENVYLKEEIKIQTNFEHILGNSDAIKYCLFNVEKVAPLNTTVLIYGETGTGKELIARAIHNASSRSSRPLIKVDCASLPPSIIESSLFGHEKGAFTGAGTKIIGRFELANGSTLFLDEISELPLDLQSKLLRITQYGEFERLGSSKTHKTDVRLIAATNRDLEEEVKKGRFREDLFFRLNVFRITIPPLRKRKEDIPEMVMEFLRNMNRKLGKKIEYISQKTLNQLISYPWPGNVRELENKIEYSVITTTGNELEVDLPTSPVSDKEREDFKIIPLAELEKEYIIKVLEMTDWKIEGKKSASEILKLAPSTLRDRIKKLKIKRK